MPRRAAKTESEGVPLREAARRLPALVKKLASAPEGKIALTVRGEVRAWLVAAESAEPEGAVDEGEATKKVKTLVKRALKAARE